jgi:hypothetical protein
MGLLGLIKRIYPVMDKRIESLYAGSFGVRGFIPPLDLRTNMKNNTRKDTVLICFLFNIVLNF